MSHTDQISLVLATYNGSVYLNEQLDSILNSIESERLIGEIIITDDGSTDQTESIVNEYITRYPFISFHKNPNKGVVNNFINGLRKTSCGYVMFCDQDDYWDKYKILKSYNAIKSMESEKGVEIPALAFTDSKVVDQNLNVINNSFLKYIGADIKDGLSLSKLMVNNVAQGCVMIINRALVSKMDFNTSSVWVMHDWWIILIAAMYKNINVIEEPLLLYRQHGSNVFGAKKNKLFRKFINLTKTYDNYKKSARRQMIQNLAFIKTYPEAEEQIGNFTAKWFIKNESSFKRRVFAVLCIGKIMRGIDIKSIQKY